MENKMFDLFIYIFILVFNYSLLKIFLTGFVAYFFNCSFSTKETVLAFLVIYAIYEISKKIIKIFTKSKGENK